MRNLYTGYIFYFRVNDGIGVGVGDPNYRVLNVEYLGSTKNSSSTYSFTEGDLFTFKAIPST